MEKYENQCTANDKLRVLNEAKAQAAMQTEMTNARLKVQIAESNGDAELALAKRQNDRKVMQAQTELAATRLQIQIAECEGDAEVARARRHAEQVGLLAEAESQRNKLTGRGEALRILQEGLAEAAVLHKKIASYGDPRLFALAFASKELAHATQPLVPQRLFMTNGTGGEANAIGGQGLVGTLLSLLVAERSGFAPTATEPMEYDELTQQLTRDATALMEDEPAPGIVT
ncbi:MAG: hypothetical protein Q8K78_00070 [Planctomycetaceae bacterium]|nr:hypothetical protein [Planctomycetaceae bacterium]